MSKLDKAKESLSTLRVLLSIFVAISVTLIGALIGNARNGIIDLYFYGGLVLIVIFALAIIAVLNKIKQITDEIEGL